MTLLETTRTAGITCLGKLVEVAFEKVRQCDAKSLETIRLALACAQQDDFFLYDVEYIAENLGWFQNKPTLALQVSGPHHGLPIVSLAYNAGGVSGREAVVTSSASGSVTTWSGRGEPLAIFRLSVHYASSLDISTNGQILFVGSTGRERKTPPAVVIYSHVDGEWKEHDGIEPKNEGFVTSVRAFKNSQNHKCCVSTSSLTNHSLQVYDINKKSPIQEYEQDDIISCVSVPGERDNIIITGSRDRTVTIYDTRMRTPSSSSSLHLNTISSLSTFGEYIFSAGLDRRLIVQDLRMPGTASYMREVDSAILSLAVHSVAQCAVSTLTGVLAINCASGVLPAASRATCGPKASSVPRYNSIAWNAKGNVLFAGGDSSTLDLYSTEFEPV
ncbi:G-protein (beta)-like protein [Angomonas deanei]|nr:G-protein (beta)-like protein [Angomonas deanei]|eukprot:EPY24593.1 G-protein (beta)-like protein [Angomonas deanei]